MNIGTIKMSAISNFKGTSLAKANCGGGRKPDGTCSCGECKLPGYDLSFGMAKIIRSKEEPKLALDRDVRIDMRNEIDSLPSKFEHEQGGELRDKEKQNVEKKAKEIIEKYRYNYEAIRCAYSMLDVNDEVDAYMALCILSHFALNSDKEIEAQKKIDDLLFNTTNNNCSTLQKNFLIYGDANNLNSLLELTKEYPEIHKKLLLDLGNISKHKGLNLNPYGIQDCINAHIYDATARDERFSLKDSVDILMANEKILYEYNRDVLKAFETKDAEILDTKKIIHFQV